MFLLKFEINRFLKDRLRLQSDSDSTPCSSLLLRLPETVCSHLITPVK